MCFGRDRDLLGEQAITEYVGEETANRRHAEFCVTSGPVFRGKLAKPKMEPGKVARSASRTEDRSVAP